MPSLSVVIIAMNEERGVGEVLAAVQQLAPLEIIFVDSGSTDRTPEIAKSYGVNFIHQDWLGYGAQKNFALSKAQGDWILSLDADEIMTAELIAEINYTLAGNLVHEYDGFTIPRILYIGDHAITHGGFYPDAHLRLFRRGKGRVKERFVHESIVVNGKVGKLKHALKNMAYDNVDQFAEAMEKYAHLSVKQALKDGFKPWKVNPINEIFHPLWTFFYRYILRQGCLDGKLGLELAVIYSGYVKKKIAYLRQETGKN